MNKKNSRILIRLFLALTLSLLSISCGKAPEKPSFEIPEQLESRETESTEETSAEESMTAAPTTKAPTTTAASTTEAPTTEAPTTAAPTTEVPTTTAAPTTEAPTTTAAPTTEAPTTTAAPTTEAPTTAAPTTEAPTTAAPTTEIPTTAAPETSPEATLPPETQPSETAPPPPPVSEAVPQGKIAYLTFDDGPSANTATVLDILDRYQAKACFFVTYQPAYADFYRQILERGHTLGIHTAYHNYETIYASFENWLADFNLVRDYVTGITGQVPMLYRFPGGSSSMYLSAPLRQQIVGYLNSIGVSYFDWNCSSEDAAGVTAEAALIENACLRIDRFPVPVILMHDGQGQTGTVPALDGILNRLQNELGYTCRALTPETPPVRAKLG